MRELSLIDGPLISSSIIGADGNPEWHCENDGRLVTRCDRMRGSVDPDRSTSQCIYFVWGSLSSISQRQNASILTNGLRGGSVRSADVVEPAAMSGVGDLHDMQPHSSPNTKGCGRALHHIAAG